MKFGRLGKLQPGYNAMTTGSSDMMMDIGYQVMGAGEKAVFRDAAWETAFVILTGQVEISWNGETGLMRRGSLFDENPCCLHVCRCTEVVLEARTAAQVLVQKTVNDKDFPAVFYRPEDVRCDIFGAGRWQGTAERIVRTIFDYDNAPCSNMVNGEVVNLPGRWSGYIPHHHPQPEVYAYRFDKPQGFGACFIGDEAFRIEDNSWVELSGGLMHPQVAAPGYAMWYSWMIRHLPGNPWQKNRTDVPEHTWLLDRSAKIWTPEKAGRPIPPEGGQ
ncbi:5-deoxy-glucuronate isomerase [Anaerovibrio sp.]|uniref:5-deoxy-glucuronate isomerase n=1 Tax=Anaerovibrio sp. TaxID=1872532 RepID=UPI003F1715A2